MIKIMDECCDCANGAYPCLGESCEKRHVKHLICDQCNADAETLYDVEGKQLCESCLETQFGTVEVPVFADKEGYHPTFIGKLPKQCAAMNMTNIMVQDMAADAAITGDIEKAFWAIAMDPLTSAVLTLKEIRDMVYEMFEAEAEWLPQFDLSKLRKVDDIEIPKDVVPVEVPEDPALAINERYKVLGS